jgi:hypothetical protein
MMEQEKCTEVSLCISWVLTKHMKPFSDADIVKECMTETATSLLKSKNDVETVTCSIASFFQHRKYATPGSRKFY